ncbi:hypothetical protein [Pseudobdellovibrio sp. HCB154]|uniref:hypothetical protein n=1 Tax=Pseudobdellovibrio sp. HCB154 TaxID=3386277 RepID=UPI0039176428
MFKQALAIVLMATSLTAFAHEGHNNTPGSLKANHGGTVKPGKEINLEYVVKGTELKIYPASHEGADLAVTDVKVTATAKLPKGKAESIKLDAKEGAFVATVDFKNAYRVEMVVTTDYQGKKDTFKFQVEK